MTYKTTETQQVYQNNESAKIKQSSSPKHSMKNNSSTTNKGVDLRKEKGESTRERIIIEAINLFGKNGYKGTSTRALAKAAECNLGLITFHFKSKQGLYNIAIDRVKSRLNEIMAPCVTRLEESIESQNISNKELYVIVVDSILQLSDNLVGMEQIAGHALFLLRDFQDNTIDINTTYANVFSPLIKTIEKALDKATDYKDPTKARLYAFLIVNAGLEFLRNYPIFYPKNKKDTITMPTVSYVIRLLVSNLLNER